MSRFNTTTRERTKTTNREGADAYAQSPKIRFASHLLTSFVQDQFYRSAEDGMAEIRQQLDAVPHRFAAQAAIYARQSFGMRSVTHVVAAELAPLITGETWAKDFYERVVKRPDDVLEILAYWNAKIHDVRYPTAAMRKGLGQALTKFDEYQLEKYRRTRHAISLHDAINLLHPPGTELLGRFMRGETQKPETWEVRKTRAGEAEDQEEAERETWHELLEQKRLGYFALLRNLRNIMQEAPDALDTAVESLTHPGFVKSSGILPFNFQRAMDAIQQEALPGRSKVLGALEEALNISVDNVPRFEGETLVALDDSGSMHTGSISEHSDTTPADIGALFTAVLAHSNDADVLLFSSDARYVGLNPQDSVLTSARVLRQNARARGTNFHCVFETASRAYDRIVLLSDMQGWERSTYGQATPEQALAAYRERTGANPYVYSFDLQGYGTGMLAEGRVYQLAGFSAKIFDVMQRLETDRNALVNAIEAVEF